jgi:hypothetical protein
LSTYIKYRHNITEKELPFVDTMVAYVKPGTTLLPVSEFFQATSVMMSTFQLNAVPKVCDNDLISCCKAVQGTF